MPRAFDLELERRWRERLQQFQQSGLSVREFCRDQDVREHTFFWWRRALAKRDRLRQAARSMAPRASRRQAMHRAILHRANPRRANPRRANPRRAILRRANPRHAAKGEARSRAARAELPRRTPAFVPVELVSESLSASWMEFRVGACLVRVPITIDERALRRAIRVVREEAAAC